MINAVSYQFNKFVEFAEERVKAGKDSAIARTGEVRIGAGTPLEERAIYSTDKTDFVGMTILRTKNAKAANDEVRELFRKSIAEMFGGEGNIPDSVKDAMLLKDYGSGKPLTARRILEVNNAIEALGRENISTHTKTARSYPDLRIWLLKTATRKPTSASSTWRPTSS